MTDPEPTEPTEAPGRPDFRDVKVVCSADDRMRTCHGCTIMPSNYQVDASPEHAEIWSVERIPFDPKGWKREMRHEIRSAIQAMRPARSDEILDAVYSSDDCSFCDVENILCYNVGASVFHHLVTGGFSMQRRFGRPERLLHHCRYARFGRIDLPSRDSLDHVFV